jgi:drug/metabolite transporter (DMT)-like permease
MEGVAMAAQVDPQRVSALRSDYRNQQVRWGFIWALWCAVLWGAWYVPGEAIYFEAPFVTMLETTGDFLLAAAVITTLNAVAVLLAMFVWVATLGKLGEYQRTLRQVKISRWFAGGAVCGGPVAIFGTFLAIGYLGAAFGAVAALLYPIVGAIAAKVWYHENITQRAALGIGVVILGGVVIFAPGILAEMSGAGEGAWLGYLGGAMAMFGWGLEGAIAGRALDVSDPDVGLTLRFTAEVAYWVVIITPLVLIFLGARALDVFTGALTNPTNYLLLALMGLSFGFCYVAWYKSFPLIGVGRGQAIAALYGPFAVIWLTVFTLQLPAWNFVVGGLVAVLGSFIMYTEKRDVLEVIRAVPAAKASQGPARSGEPV